MSRRLRQLFGVSVVLAASFTAGRVDAAPLLTASYETQLEAWLGQGDLTFTNIFTKIDGNTSLDFHTAADNQGATFSLFEVQFNENWYVIGGYNPQSWSSIGDYNYTLLDADRTAFIYNLTTGVKQDQRLSTDPYITTDDFGQYQTYNNDKSAADFGDLGLNASLQAFRPYQYSYGSGDPCGDGGANIFGEASRDLPCTGKLPAFKPLPTAAFEVYTFTVSPTNVPEPASAALLLMGIAMLVRGRKISF